MFENTVSALIENVEGRDTPITDADLQITLDTGDVDYKLLRKLSTFKKDVLLVGKFDHWLS